jgi:hypothetical protein
MVGSQIANLTPTLLLAITCVSSVQMGHASPFQISTFQELSNDIKNPSIQWVLVPAIALWKFKSPFGTPTPKMGVHLGVWGFILSFFCTPRSIRCDSWDSLLVRILASPCLGRKSKVRVVTTDLLSSPKLVIDTTCLNTRHPFSLSLPNSLTFDLPTFHH